MDHRISRPANTPFERWTHFRAKHRQWRTYLSSAGSRSWLPFGDVPKHRQWRNDWVHNRAQRPEPIPPKQALSRHYAVQYTTMMITS